MALREVEKSPPLKTYYIYIYIEKVRETIKSHAEYAMQKLRNSDRMADQSER